MTSGCYQRPDAEYTNSTRSSANRRMAKIISCTHGQPRLGPASIPSSSLCQHLIHRHHPTSSCFWMISCKTQISYENAPLSSSQLHILPQTQNDGRTARAWQELSLAFCILSFTCQGSFYFCSYAFAGHQPKHVYV